MPPIYITTLLLSLMLPESCVSIKKLIVEKGFLVKITILCFLKMQSSLTAYKTFGKDVLGSLQLAKTNFAKSLEKNLLQIPFQKYVLFYLQLNSLKSFFRVVIVKSSFNFNVQTCEKHVAKFILSNIKSLFSFMKFYIR